MKKKEANLTLEALLTSEQPENLLTNIDYEQGVNLLQQLVESVEASDLSLDRSVLSYERGMALLGHLQNLLNAAEEKLKVLQLPKQKK
jgi:exodeoxyribonuclease VII small subunit